MAAQGGQEPIVLLEKALIDEEDGLALEVCIWIVKKWLFKMAKTSDNFQSDKQ
jgi:hypothetical protein